MIKATISDLNEIVNLYQEVIEEMLKNGIVQWDKNYPNRDVLYDDIINGEMYILKKENKIVGCVVLNDIEVIQYQGVDWTLEDEALIVHRVAIASGYQGQGLVKEMLKFCEEFAKQHEIYYLKTDTSVSNAAMNSVYLKYGYKQVGQIFSRGRIVPLNCFEKILTRD